MKEKVEGLEIGADDYLTKPYHVDEMLARVLTHLLELQSKLVREALEQQHVMHVLEHTGATRSRRPRSWESAGYSLREAEDLRAGLSRNGNFPGGLNSVEENCRE